MATVTYRTAKENAFALIMEKLLSSAYKPGARISELGLSKELGISRAPVREAFNQLASSGCVELVPGFGAYVRIPSRVELQELYQCREAMECLAAELAARRIMPGQLHEIRKGCDLIAGVIARFEKEGLTDYDDAAATQFIEGDLLIHHAIMKASGNGWLTRTLGQLHFLIRGWSQKPDFTRFPILKMLRLADKEHRSILRALEAGDPQAARSAMRRHVRRTGRCFVRQYSVEKANTLRYPAAAMKKLIKFESEIKQG